MWVPAAYILLLMAYPGNGTACTKVAIPSFSSQAACVEAMLDSGGLKRWAVEASHFELPEAASLVVEAGSWAGGASVATKALGTPARMDLIDCLGPAEGTVPSVVSVSVRK